MKEHPLAKDALKLATPMVRRAVSNKAASV